MEGTAKKPSYLGLLNAIALGEGRAHQYLSCWAAKTPDADVRKIIATVAIREGEHSHAFTKRLCELGFAVQDRPDPTFEKNMAIANADCSDLEKFEALGYGRGGEMRRDPFKGIFDDESIDVQTGELLGRYIAEERDSGRMLRGCYNVLSERAGARRPAMAAAAGASELRDLHGRLDEICAAIGKLQQEVTAIRR
jgi:rubrerythrin